MKLLLIAFTLPPERSPRSIQISKLIKALPFKPDIVHAKTRSNSDESVCPNFQSYINQSFVYECPRGNRYLNFIKRKCLGIFFNTPDVYKFWAKSTHKKLKKDGQLPKYDTIVTFGQPMSLHLIGLNIKKEFNIRWVAHFSDPWVCNPFNKSGKIITYLNRSLERQVIKYADTVVFTSEETKALYQQEYQDVNATKFEYLQHCFDPKRYQKNVSPASSPFVFAHLGNFYGIRSPEILFQAVDSLYRNNPTLLEAVRFDFYGSFGRHSHLPHKYAHLRQYIQSQGSLNYLESLGVMQKSHVLLIIDSALNFSVFFPSKLADYIGAKRPILGITPAGSASNILKNLNHLQVLPTDLPGLTKIIKMILQNKEEYRTYEQKPGFEAFENIKAAVAFQDILSRLPPIS